MDMSFKIASFLDDMDIEYNVFPSDDEGISIEFSYDNNFYLVTIDQDELLINGEGPLTYKDFISSVF